MSVRIGDVTIRIGASTNQLQADLRRAERSLQNSAQRFNAIGQGLTISLTAPLIGLGAAATTSFAEIERLQNSLTAVMGDAKAAGEEFERLRKVAEAPGLALPQVVSASAKLQAVGLSAEEARDTISQYGNAVARSGGQAQEFDGAILALTQIASKGKISAEELNQLGERIFEIRPALEAAFGTSNSEELQKLGITAEEFIAKTTAELGKLERVQGGLSNAFENFRDNITAALSTLGESISSAIDLPSLLDKISGAVAKVGEFFRNLSPETQKIIVYFGLFVAAIGPLLIIFGKLSLAIGTIRIAMVGLQVAFTQGGLLAAFSFLGGPAIAGIAALSAAVYLLYKNWETVKTALIDVINYFIDLYNESVIFRGAINYIILGFKQIYQAGKLAVNLIINGFKLAFKFLIDNFANVGKIAKAVLTLDFKSIPRIIADAYKNGFDNVKEFIGDSANDFNEFGKNTGENIINGLNNTLRGNKIKKITSDDIFSKDINETNIGDTKLKKEFEDTPKINPELAKELAKIQAELANVDKLFKAGLITPAEQAQQKIKLLEDRLKLLVINGFKPQSKAVLDTKNQIQGLKDGQEAIIKPVQTFLQLINVIPGKLNPVAQQASALQLRFFELDQQLKAGTITSFEATGQKVEFLNSEMQRLKDEGVAPTSAEFLKLSNAYAKLATEQDGIVKNIGALVTGVKDLSDPLQLLADETLTELNKQITIIQEKTAAGLISQSDADVERINAIKTALNSLIEQGLGGTDAAAKLQEQLKGAESSVKTTYTNIFDFLGNKIASLPGIADKLGEGVSTLGPKIGKAFEGAVAAVQQVFSTFGAFFDMQEARIDQFEAKEKERIENSIMSEEAKEAALEKLNETVLQKRKKLARKQAAIDKASALFSATIAGANAVLQALAVPIIGPVLAKITAGLVAAQLAFIAAAPLPSLNVGTDLVKSDGLAMIHKGEAIVPANVAKGGFSGGNGIAQVSGRIQGTDIILVSDYAMNFKNRIR